MLSIWCWFDVGLSLDCLVEHGPVHSKYPVLVMCLTNDTLTQSTLNQINLTNVPPSPEYLECLESGHFGWGSSAVEEEGDVIKTSSSTKEP